jgi:hypothetical protein
MAIATSTTPKKSRWKFKTFASILVFVILIVLYGLSTSDETANQGPVPTFQQ